MAGETRHVMAVVLAAGTASRFGSAKALAILEGRPLLQHVLDALAAAGLGDVTVVLGRAADEIERAVAWRTERRIRNPDPERGLASSVHAGLAALPADADAALIVLGDQPRLRPDVIRAVVDRWRAGSNAIVAPRYAASGTLNPVLLARAAWPEGMAITGDRGMGPMIHERPDLVTYVDVDGDNPDVDTVEDLVRLTSQGGSTTEPTASARPNATASANATPATPPEGGSGSAAHLSADWAARVAANRGQVERFRETPPGGDFYRPTTSLFRADPFRTDDAVLNALVALTRPDDVWLDIGAGAGRFALPLARRVRELVALDPSTGMLDGLRSGMVQHGIGNVRVIEGRWPADAHRLAADVALIAHVGYDVEEIGPFLDAMDRAAGRLCVAVLMEQAPAALAHGFWPAIHGEARVPLPALGDLVALLEACGRAVTVQMIPGEPRFWATPDEALVFLRQQLWVEPDGAKGRQLVELVHALPRQPDGAITIDSSHRAIGIVTWQPGR